MYNVEPNLIWLNSTSSGSCHLFKRSSLQHALNEIISQKIAFTMDNEESPRDTLESK